MLWPWLAPGLRHAPRIREARWHDLSRFADIHTEGFAVGWTQDEMEAMLQSGCVADTMLSVGLFGEIVTGFAISRLVLNEAELLSIALDDEVRGRGYAAKLLTYHAARLRRAGAERLFLEVAADNAPALRLYRKLGFITIGCRKGYYPASASPSAPRRDALMMQWSLTGFDPTPRGWI